MTRSPGERLFNEPASAKVNLGLRVLRRRADGYHELESLIAFADVGDVVTVDTGRPVAVSVSGPFGSTISSENLLDVTLRLALAAEPRLVLGAVHLEKRLPVAAGIGGGSADAAALLRCVKRANPGLSNGVDWPAIALRIGADVPVCLVNRAACVSGIGEAVTALDGFPALPAVLVNPLVPVPADKTAQVFRRLGAPPNDRGTVSIPQPTITQPGDVIAFAEATGNELLAPARAVVPQIDEVLSALRATAGFAYVGLSGGGPTCFGLFWTVRDAEVAAASLLGEHPHWWVVATTLR